MIHDTQYTQEEYDSDKMIVQGFGHSTYDMAVQNAVMAGVPNLYCMHFNPVHTDKKLHDIEEKWKGIAPPVKVALAREGMEIEV